MRLVSVRPILRRRGMIPAAGAPLQIMLGLLALGWLVAPTRAAAQSLEVSDCPEPLSQAIEAAIAVELTDAEPEVVALADEARLSARCGASDVALRAEAEGGRYAGQDVPLDVGTPRRAAITLLELLRALVLVAPVEATPSPGPRSLLVAMGSVSLLGDPLLVLGGGGIGVRVAIDPLVMLGLSLDAAAGGLDTAPGQLGLLVAQASLSVRLGGRVGELQLHAGPQVSGALVSWSGTPRSPEVTALPVLGPRVSAGVVASASYLLAEVVALDVELTVDGAFVGSEALADGVAVARTLGAGFSARVGLGWVIP